MEVAEASPTRLRLLLPISRWAVPFATVPWLMPALAWHFWLGWLEFAVAFLTAVFVTAEIVPARYEVIADSARGRLTVIHSGPFKRRREFVVEVGDVTGVDTERITSRLSAQRVSHRLHIRTRSGAGIVVNEEAVKRDLEPSARLLRGFLGIPEDEPEE